jgi:hypothetical protein
VTIVNEVPFESALRKTFTTGIESGAKWTLALDADVLVRPGGLAALIRDAETMPCESAQVGGLVFDKITGLFRQAGNRVYRTTLLPIALACVPPTGSEPTPEFFVARVLGSKGHAAIKSDVVVGLHDFEQSFADLYRKAMLHSAKHRRLIAEMITLCAERGERDPDYRVILKALWDGLSVGHVPTVDARNHAAEGERAIQSLGLVEKPPLDWASPTQNTAEAFSSLEERHSSRLAAAHPRLRNRIIGAIRRRFDRHGPVKGLAACLGAALRGVGSWLDR